MGKAVEFVPTSWVRGSERIYRVVKLTNAVTPPIGSELTEGEVIKLGNRPGWKYTIKEANR